MPCSLAMLFRHLRFLHLLHCGCWGTTVERTCTLALSCGWKREIKFKKRLFVRYFGASCGLKWGYWQAKNAYVIVQNVSWQVFFKVFINSVPSKVIIIVIFFTFAGVNMHWAHLRTHFNPWAETTLSRIQNTFIPTNINSDFDNLKNKPEIWCSIPLSDYITIPCKLVTRIGT